MRASEPNDNAHAASERDDNERASGSDDSVRVSKLASEKVGQDGERDSERDDSERASQPDGSEPASERRDNERASIYGECDYTHPSAVGGRSVVGDLSSRPFAASSDVEADRVAALLTAKVMSQLPSLDQLVARLQAEQAKQTTGDKKSNGGRRGRRGR